MGGEVRAGKAASGDLSCEARDQTSEAGAAGMIDGDDAPGAAGVTCGAWLGGGMLGSRAEAAGWVRLSGFGGAVGDACSSAGM